MPSLSLFIWIKLTNIMYKNLKKKIIFKFCAEYFKLQNSLLYFELRTCIQISQT